MSTELAPLLDADRVVVERLWQLYWHDLSELRGSMPNEEGLFKTEKLAAYLDGADTTAFLIRHEGAPAGFAFVSKLESGRWSIAEFFVVRAVRRRGVGYRVGRELIARHPGEWEIGFQAANTGAPELWRRLAADVAGDDWREETRPVPGKPWIPHDHFVIFRV